MMFRYDGFLNDTNIGYITNSNWKWDQKTKDSILEITVCIITYFGYLFK